MDRGRRHLKRKVSRKKSLLSEKDSRSSARETPGEISSKAPPSPVKQAGDMPAQTQPTTHKVQDKVARPPIPPGKDRKPAAPPRATERPAETVKSDAVAKPVETVRRVETTRKAHPARPAETVVKPGRTESKIPAQKKVRHKTGDMKAAQKREPKPAVEALPPKEKARPKKLLFRQIWETFVGRAAKEEKTEVTEARKKQRMRLFRSIEHRSRLALIGALAVLVVVLSAMSWHSSRARERMIEDLKLFTVPTNVDEFRPGSEPSANAVIAKGEEIVPVLLEEYPELNYEQKAAILYILGELPRPDSFEILQQAILDYDPTKTQTKILKDFAVRSLAKLGESIVEPILQGLSTRTGQQQDDLLDAIARTRAEAAERRLLQLSRETGNPTRKILAAKLVYFETANSIRRLFEMTQEGEPQVADQAFSSLESLQKKEIIGKYPELLNELDSQVYGRFQRLENDSEIKASAIRSRLLSLMGIMGAADVKYAAKFKETLRTWLVKESSSPDEIAAAACALGMIRDRDSLTRLVQRLDHQDPVVVNSVSRALIRLQSVDAVEALVQAKEIFTQTQNLHVLPQVAAILKDLHLYAEQESELLDKAVLLLTEISGKASGDAAEKIQKTLVLYQNSQKALKETEVEEEAE